MLVGCEIIWKRFKGVWTLVALDGDQYMRIKRYLPWEETVAARNEPRRKRTGRKGTFMAHGARWVVTKLLLSTEATAITSLADLFHNITRTRFKRMIASMAPPLGLKVAFTGYFERIRDPQTLSVGH